MMHSKNWKLLLIATVSATFVACGEQKQTNSNSSNSAYAGVWMNKAAYDSLTKSRNLSQFCRSAKKKRKEHGLPAANGKMLPFYVPAISIENNGDVRRLEIIPQASTMPQGRVDFHGVYSSDNNALSNVIASNSQLNIRAGQLTVSSITSQGINSPSRALVSTNRDVALDYIEKMKLCIWGHNADYVDNDWANGDNYEKPDSEVTDQELEEIDIDFGGVDKG